MIDSRQTYHLEPQYGLLNDPVGLVWYKDHYHVFFQWNSKKKDHSSKEWGHFSSRDLKHWTQHESPLKPGEDYDLNGVYSGSAAIVDDQLQVWYTGNRKYDGKRKVRQCMAVSNDGYHFDKLGPVLESPPGYTQHFRDPRVLMQNGHYNMLIGAQNEKLQGDLLWFASPDGKDWSKPQIIGHSEQYNMIECPELIEGESENALIYNLQKRDPVDDAVLDSFCVYQILPKEHELPLDLDQGWMRTDDGFDCFAAQCLKDGNGRYLMYAWMNRLSDEQEKMLAEMGNSIHCLTLPREITIHNDRLIQKPARELYELFESSPTALVQQMELNSRSWLLTLNLLDQQDESFEILINTTEAMIAWSRQEHLFTLFRKDWSSGGWEERSCHLDQLKKVEVFADHSSLEVFLNDGEHVLSTRILPASNTSSLRAERIHPSIEADIRLFTGDSPFCKAEESVCRQNCQAEVDRKKNQETEQLNDL